jgi:hypothetical protein
MTAKSLFEIVPPADEREALELDSWLNHQYATDHGTKRAKSKRSTRNVQGRIYFVRAEGTNLVKIGWCKGVPLKRMRTLQTGSAHKLLLLADMPGDQRKERSLHASFKHLRSHGEWFLDEGELSDTIDAILLGGDV